MNSNETESLQLSGGLDIVSFLSVIRRRAISSLLVFLVVIGIASYVTFTAVPKYRATASILISRDTAQMTLEDVFTMDPAQGSSFTTRVSLFRSKKLATEVYEGLKASNELAEDLSSPEAIMSATEAIPIRNTRIVEVSVTSVSPKGAADCANTVADEFIAWYGEESKRTASFYSTQLQSLEEQITNINASTNQFVREHGLVTPEIWSAYRDELASLRKEVSERTQELQAMERRVAEIRQIEGGDGDFSRLLFVRKDPVIASLCMTRMELEKELAVASQTYGPSHPKIQSLTANLKKTRDDILAVSKELAQEYISGYEFSRSELASLRDSFDRRETESREMLALIQQYSKLERELKSTQSLYDIVLQKMKESGMSTSTDVEPTQIIDMAVPSTVPVSPKVKLNLALGIILGLILAVAFAFLMDYFDDTIKTAEEVHVATAIPGSEAACPILGYIGEISVEGEGDFVRERICSMDPKTAYAEAYRSLRTSIVFSFTEPGSKVILVSSPGSSEGKTINVANLGIAIAQNGLRTLIVDADMRKPKVHKVFGVAHDKGLSSILTGNAAVADVVQATDVPNLSVIPCGPIPPLPNELLGGTRFRELVASLREQFDFVILDSPPGIVADAMVMAPTSDGVAIVVRSGTTSRRHLRMFADQLRQSGTKLLGVVLNDVESKMRYGYNYYYSYRYKYGYKYYGSEKDTSGDRSSGSRAASL